MTGRWYTREDDGGVTCTLCAHGCRIKPGRLGRCGVRENREGSLVSRIYDGGRGLIVAQNVDPIEKKPLYHVQPGSLSFSVACVGCNLDCDFCQNAQIAQWPVTSPQGLPGQWTAPQTLVDQALDAGCTSISYTYTEPTVYLEVVEDTAKLARRAGLLNLMVTNGFMGTDARESMIPLVDGANVDLKAFRDDFYKTHCRARLAPVLETLEALKRGGVWVEVTTLVIPGLNDDPGELAELAAFIAERLGRETPWHISRFHPCHRRTDRGPTPLETLEQAAGMGRAAGLDFVYLGNVPGSDFQHTHCPACATPVVVRQGYQTQNHLSPSGACPGCGAQLPGRFGVSGR